MAGTGGEGGPIRAGSMLGKTFGGGEVEKQNTPRPFAEMPQTTRGIKLRDIEIVGGRDGIL